MFWHDRWPRVCRFREAMIDGLSDAPTYHKNSTRSFQRRLPLGAEVQPGGGVHFRVWAPALDWLTIEVGADPELTAARAIEAVEEEGGYFSVFVPDATAGMFYRLRTEAGAAPDPASRFQPNG